MTSTLTAPTDRTVADRHGPATRWHTWHLHVDSTSPSAQDEIITQCLYPVVRELAPGRWFFLRYWQGGPHVRLRVADLSPIACRQLQDALERELGRVLPGIATDIEPTAYLAQATGFAAAGETGESMVVEALLPPGVHVAGYEPEFERYGGVEVMALSEALFHVSSELAVALCRRRKPGADAVGDGLLAMAAGLSVLTDDTARRFYLEHVRDAWTQWGLAALPGYEPQRVASMAAAHAARLRPAAGRLTAMSRAPGPLWEQWTRPLAEAMPMWAGASRDDRRAARILSSHVHMLENRLGVGGGREGYLASVLLDLLAA